MFGVDDVVGSPSLVALSGHLANRKIQFLLDSGASCNFISQDLLLRLGLDWDLCISQKVRLADGQILSTVGKTELRCTLGPLTYIGTFHVLQARVPLILGMTFFQTIDPIIRWQDRSVIVRRGKQLLQLPVVKYMAQKGKLSTQKSRPSVTACTNPFSALTVQQCSDDVDDVGISCAVQQLSSGVQQLASVRGDAGHLVTAHDHSLDDVQVCIQCGKHLKANHKRERCFKCDNGSFSHIQNQLVDIDGEISVQFRDTLPNASGQVAHIQGGSVPAEGQCNAAAYVPHTGKDNGADSTEIVPFSQYVQGGKREQYLTYGVIMPEKMAQDRLTTADILAALTKEQQLVAEAYGGVDYLLKLFYLAQDRGLDCIQLQCRQCGKFHVDDQSQLASRDLSQLSCKCKHCGASLGRDLRSVSVANPLTNVFHELQMLKQSQHLQFNFTHRAAHGGNDDADVAHGQMEKLAKDQLELLKAKYPQVFKEPIYPVDRTDCEMQFEHKIPLIDESAPPPKRRLYPLDGVELAELKKQIEEFLSSNRIEPSDGAYGAPILFAKKKDGKLRMCIDYRMLNQQTKSDVFPLPRIDELLQRLDGAQVFSKLDLRDGYHQIPMAPSDKVKTAFTCRYGTYQFTVMPFGLMTAPSTFQRMMNRVFFDLLDEGVLCYLDDLLIYSRTVEEHKQILDKVFALLNKNKLFIKESKCHLFLQKVNFLGHVVDRHGVSLESGKVDAVQKWPVPQNVTHVQQFLGLCNYYRRFVARFSEIAGPLTLLTRKGQQFIWGDQQQKAFEALKACLCSSPVLRVFDPTKATRVVCDASAFCCGAVLEQQHDDKWNPVEFFSKRLSSAERNYSATDREFVAIKLALERWRQFLIGQKFLLLTDHAALTYLHTTASVSRRNARWLDFLSQFDFDIQHIKGRENVVADLLSRVPGAEELSSSMLCSFSHSLGVLHVNDVPVQLESSALVAPVITIHENDTFLEQLRLEQQQSTSDWFRLRCVDAEQGSTVFVFRDGILCKLVEDVFCPVIPTSDSPSVRVVLADLHSNSLAGHFGVKKLLKLAQKRFYWQNMFRSCEQFVKACPVCQANKSSTVKPAGLLQPLENPARPFEHVSMDFIVSLPTCSQGFDCIFTIVDRFSRFVKFIPCMTSMDAVECARLFFEQWVCVYGMPSKIISDRDVKFTSKFWQGLCDLLQCRVALSSAYHPQTDGLTERYHRSVEQVLRCYCSQQQELWSSYLQQCAFALNSTFQDAIQDVPFSVLYGFTPVLPLDHTVQRVQLPAVSSFVAARAQIHQQVTTSLAESRRRMEGVANPKRRDVTHAPGDRVWLSAAHLPLRSGARKLASRWAGPFRILERIGGAAYRLELPGAWRVHPVFHVSQLKAVVGSPQGEQAVPLDAGGPEEYEVERLLAVRTARGRKEYLVHWKGYGSWEDSWEPEENLANAQEKLKAFWQSRGRRAR